MISTSHKLMHDDLQNIIKRVKENSNSDILIYYAPNDPESLNYAEGLKKGLTIEGVTSVTLVCETRPESVNRKILYGQTVNDYMIFVGAFPDLAMTSK